MDVFSWRTAWILATGLTVLRMGEAFRHVVPPWESWIWFLVGISPAPFILGGFFLYRRHTMRALEMKVRALRRQVAQGKRAEEADNRRLQSAIAAVEKKASEADAKLSADLDFNPVAPILSAAADAEDGGDDIVSQLERLGSLRDAGHLTQGQFDMAKEAVLRGSSAVAVSGERATAIPTATATAATGSASTSVSATTASSADMITAAPSAGQSLSAAAQELQSLLSGRSAAARERCDAYHAAVRYSPDEDVLLFVSEAMAWRKKVLRAENSKQIIAAEDEISPQDVLAESVTAGELFEEYLSREASDRILADGGGAVALDHSARTAIVDAVMSSGGGCGGDDLPSATFDAAIACALEQLARGHFSIF